MCPVGAFSGRTEALFDKQRCKGYLATSEGDGCLTAGCKARAACPVGAAYRYLPAQAFLHMNHFATT